MASVTGHNAFEWVRLCVSQTRWWCTLGKWQSKIGKTVGFEKRVPTWCKCCLIETDHPCSLLWRLSRSCDFFVQINSFFEIIDRSQAWRIVCEYLHMYRGYKFFKSWIRPPPSRQTSFATLSSFPLQETEHNLSFGLFWTSPRSGGHNLSRTSLPLCSETGPRSSFCCSKVWTSNLSISLPKRNVTSIRRVVSSQQDMPETVRDGWFSFSVWTGPFPLATARPFPFPPSPSPTLSDDGEAFLWNLLCLHVC